MDAYTKFAQVYDLFMDDVPYEQWCAFLTERLKEYGIEDGLVLDLGCGTGKMTELFAEKGYDMIGVDNSIEMLEIARERTRGSILYLNQDMREFELYGTVRAVYSACDSLNYIGTKEELLSVFKLVNNYLDPKGLFFFDMNTEFKYRELLGENTFAENREEGSFIWENFYDEKRRENEYDLTLFIRETDGRFSRCQECHCQKCYTAEEMKELVAEAGMELLGIYDGYTGNGLRKDSERMLFVARERGKAE